MKVLFLDIDGVLNSFDNMRAIYSLNKHDSNNKSRDEFGTLFDERCVRWLAWIINKTSCKIVISSTWRLSGLGVMQTMWSNRDLPGEVVDITPTTISQHTIDSYTDTLEDVSRGYEIQEWLDNNDIEQYYIVDDESDMLPGQNFVLTDEQVGITHQNARDIVRILNNQ